MHDGPFWSEAFLSAPSILWVNHASYLLATDRFSLITDPWLFGAAFNNGWDLVSPTRLTPEDFGGIDYIWISHEHPDHFVPAVLKAIPEDARARITILFQETSDKKVPKFCRGLGFRIRELPITGSLFVDDKFGVLCGRMDDYDSWLLIETEGLRILNLNDCVINSVAKARAIHKRTGQVDVLLSQFGYAQWVGNPDEKEARERASLEKLQRLRYQADVLHPKYLIPFASYVYFSHEENAYLNDYLGNIRQASDFISRETTSTPIVLYPGDRWTIGAPWDNAKAIESYERDYRETDKKLRTSASVPEEKLVELADRYVRRVHQHNDVHLALLLERLMPSTFVRRVRIRLWDLQKTGLFDFQHGLRLIENDEIPPDAEMSSDSLAYVFRFDWGMGTLEVNGRFRASSEGKRRLLATFRMAGLNNFGDRFDVRHVLGRAMSKTLRVFGKLA
jgi:L-ascorbate metabolism protein UlaG (beta-lactamase superfamily)